MMEWRPLLSYLPASGRPACKIARFMGGMRAHSVEGSVSFTEQYHVAREIPRATQILEWNGSDRAFIREISASPKQDAHFLP